VDLATIASLALASAALFIALSRRRPGPDAPDAVRRDLARLVEELQAASRDQVARLDREVKRLQAAVAEAERARLALEKARVPSPAPKAPASPDRTTNPLHRRVFELRDAGKPPADIGVETGLEVGEVELILGLREMPPRA
jgi:hypothetical protein